MSRSDDLDDPNLESVFYARSKIYGLASLSGICGLAYQVLFVRLFSNYFGDSFIVVGVTLCSVFLGMATGAWFSRNLVRYLGWIEVSIGAYAIIAATVFSNFGLQIAAWQISPLTTAVKLFLLLGLPAFLIGTCIPIFSSYAREFGITKQTVFASVYGFYNLGAFWGILLIEFWLFRQLGLQWTLYIVGLLNCSVGAILIWMFRAKSFYYRNRYHGKLKPNIAVALFFASVASGVFQLYILKVSFSIFGPLQENFAIILGSAVGGLAIGAACSQARWLTLPRAIILSSLIVLVLTATTSELVKAWSSIANWEINDASNLLTKITLLGGFPLLAFITLGTLVPLALNAHENNKGVSGFLLGISSLGNGTGALLMFLVAYRYLEMPTISIGISLLLIIAGFIVESKKTNFSKVAIIALFASVLAFLGVRNWPGDELLLGYRVISQKEVLEQKLSEITEERTYKIFDQSASIVSFSDGSRSLVFNGYHSLTFGRGGKSELHEAVVGATPALFVENNSSALVLGLGTGITAGATAQVFNDTLVVEVNPAMTNIPNHFESENFGFEEREGVRVLFQDGISVTLDPNSTFDAIVNTVTTPRYYTASKLYTDDFLKLVKARLSEKGVYSTWFDLNMGLEGISIMLNTLESNFETCRFFVMTMSYFNAVCGDHDLTYQTSSTISKRMRNGQIVNIFQKYDLESDFAETLNALEVSFEEDLLVRNSAEINTLDRPLIEFVVARQFKQQETNSVLSNTILANIERQRQLAFTGVEWKRNCHIIAKMSGLVFRGCG